MRRILRLALRTAAVAAAALAVGGAGLTLHSRRGSSSAFAQRRLCHPKRSSPSRHSVSGASTSGSSCASRSRAPVLLFLHGGPGSPMMPLARELEGSLSRHFVVWTGTNAVPGSRSRCASRATRYARAFRRRRRRVDREAATRFGVERIFLAGSSWGTVLGADLVSRRPDLSMPSSRSRPTCTVRKGRRSHTPTCTNACASAETATTFARRGGRATPLRQRARRRAERQWLRRCGGIFPTRMELFLARYGYASPEYSLLDIVRFAVGEAFSGGTLVMDLLRSVDLPGQVPDRGAGLLLPGPPRSTDTVRAGRGLLRAPRCAAWQASRVRTLGARPESRGAGAIAAPPGREVSTRRAARRLEAAIESPPLDPALRALPRNPSTDGTRSGSRAAACGVASRATGRSAASASRTSPTAHRRARRRPPGGLDLEALHGHARHATGRSRPPGPGRRRESPPPAERRVRSPDGQPAQVTLRQLLSHRSGLPPLGSGVSFPELVGMGLRLTPIPDFDTYLANGLLLRRTRARAARLERRLHPARLDCRVHRGRRFDRPRTERDPRSRRDGCERLRPRVATAPRAVCLGYSLDDEDGLRR